MPLAHLQLLYCFTSFADDQPHFGRRDQKLLNGAVAINIVVKSRSVPTAIYNLPQQPLGLAWEENQGKEPLDNNAPRHPEPRDQRDGRGEEVERWRKPEAAQWLLSLAVLKLLDILSPIP